MNAENPSSSPNAPQKNSWYQHPLFQGAGAVAGMLALLLVLANSPKETTTPPTFQPQGPLALPTGIAPTPKAPLYTLEYQGWSDSEKAVTPEEVIYLHMQAKNLVDLQKTYFERTYNSKLPQTMFGFALESKTSFEDLGTPWPTRTEGSAWELLGALQKPEEKNADNVTTPALPILPLPESQKNEN